MPFDDVGDGILGNAEVAGDPAIAPPVFDSLEYLQREPVRFGALSRLAPEFPASCQHPVKPSDFLAGQGPGVLSGGIARDAPDRIAGNVAAGARIANERRCKAGCLLAAFQTAAGVR